MVWHSSIEVIERLAGLLVNVAALRAELWVFDVHRPLADRGGRKRAELRPQAPAKFQTVPPWRCGAA